MAQAEVLALTVIADRIEHGEHPVEPIQIIFTGAWQLEKLESAASSSRISSA